MAEALAAGARKIDASFDIAEEIVRILCLPNARRHTFRASAWSAEHTIWQASGSVHRAALADLLEFGQAVNFNFERQICPKCTSYRPVRVSHRDSNLGGGDQYYLYY